MFTVKMFFDQQRIHGCLWVDIERNECHFRDLFQDNSIVNSIVWVFSPRKRAMIFNQYARCVHIVDLIFIELFYNDHACIQFIFIHLLFYHIVSAGDSIMEIICVCRTDVRNVAACLCPCCGIGRVSMDNTSDLGKVSIEFQMCRSV